MSKPDITARERECMREREPEYCPRCGYDFADQDRPCKSISGCPHPGTPTFKRLHEAMDRIILSEMPSIMLRADNTGLPYSEIEVTEGPLPNPFPCLTIKYWPNGKES
jgi:hypothetical protein